jgi:hypothetical protein
MSNQRQKGKAPSQCQTTETDGLGCASTCSRGSLALIFVRPAEMTSSDHVQRSDDINAGVRQQGFVTANGIQPLQAVSDTILDPTRWIRARYQIVTVPAAFEPELGPALRTRLAERALSGAGAGCRGGTRKTPT